MRMGVSNDLKDVGGERAIGPFIKVLSLFLIRDRARVLEGPLKKE